VATIHGKSNVETLAPEFSPERVGRSGAPAASFAPPAASRPAAAAGEFGFE
jgi:hypothetical protein